MNIAWHYLDKRSAAINALNDYESMKYILDHIPEEINELKKGMQSITSPRLSDMPKAPHDPHAGENKIINNLDSIDIMESRHQRAKEFFDWFQPAWNGLSDAERYVLTCFFLEKTDQQEGVNQICEHFHIERSSAYKKKDRALSHLALLLYGK